MKKFFAIAFIAAAFASCGDAAKTDKPAADTAKVVTPAPAPTQDTAAKVDSAKPAAAPTQDTAKKADKK